MHGQMMLLGGHRFACACDACSMPLDAVAASDERRAGVDRLLRTGLDEAGGAVTVAAGEALATMHYLKQPSPLRIVTMTLTLDEAGGAATVTAGQPGLHFRACCFALPVFVGPLSAVGKQCIALRLITICACASDAGS